MKGIQYLIDESGKKMAIVLELQGHEEAIEEFLEEIYGHEKIKERHGEPTMSKDDFLKGLKDDGLL
jgi:hypothetical protein